MSSPYLTDTELAAARESVSRWPDGVNGASYLSDQPYSRAQDVIHRYKTDPSCLEHG